MNQNNMQTDPDRYQDQDPESGGILEQITGFFRPPVFEDDPDKTRQALVLNASLLAFLGVMLLLPLSSVVFGGDPLPRLLFFGGVILPIITYSLVAIRRGQVRGTAGLFLTLLWLTMAVGTWLFGRITENPLIIGPLVVILLAGFLLSTRVSVLFGVLTFINLLAFYFVGNQIELPTLIEGNISIFYQGLSLILIIFTAFVALLNTSYQSTIAEVRKSDQALRQSNIELERIRTYLEEEVTSNTKQLERRSQYLEAAAKVASASIITMDLREMLDAVAKEIGDRFSFYHVGIFILDERQEWAVLRAASSQGGRQMIARNHRLAVGRQGIVGFVTSIGQARISQDVELDRIHSVTTELPDTRSEMALPLISRGKTIGAIDIQDDKPNAFTREDITVLQTMADQIALAIENLLLYQQTQENLEEIQRVYGQFSEEAWREIRQKQMLASYRYFGGAITRIEDAEVPTLLEDKVSIPVQVRGVSLGAIEISKGDDLSNWTDEEMKLLRALSDQIGIALDSARLFNESQLRATTEHTIGEINSQLWETLDIDTILKTTANNLREKLALPELTIRMSSPDGSDSSASNGSESDSQPARDN